MGIGKFIEVCLICRGANLLAVNAEGNMPYDICDEEATLDYIESEMAKRGVTQELIEEIRALPETKMLEDMQAIASRGGDLECRDSDGATPVSFIPVPCTLSDLIIHLVVFATCKVS